MRIVKRIGWIGVWLGVPLLMHAKTVTYTVKKGDTLISIAKRYHMALSTLRSLNHLSSSSVIKVGQTLILKKNRQAKKKKTRTYTVQKGDTLIAIAKRYHTTVTKLKALNGLRSASSIRIGQRLVVASKPVRTEQRHIAERKRRKRLATALRRHTTVSSRIRFKKAKRRGSIRDIVFGNALRYDVASLSPKSRRIIALAKRKLGRRYVWGAAGRHNTFDCSGLTSYVCRQVGIKLPRRAIQQSRVGKYITRSQLKPGDLVFFDTSRRRRGYVNHVGIYIGNGKFIHASSAKKRVIITSLDKPFYKQRFKWGRRITSM